MTKIIEVSLPFWGLVLITFGILMVGCLMFWAVDSICQKKSEERTRGRKNIADIFGQLSDLKLKYRILDDELKGLHGKIKEIIDAIGEDSDGNLLVTATHDMLTNTIKRVYNLEEKVSRQGINICENKMKTGSLEAELTAELRDQGIKLNKLKRRLKKEEKS